jgi:3-hydroxyisobutyrate dehydrogenase-like beta-hydroxyacid dehydrogenase
MKVAFVGLGHLGAPMSHNILAAGHGLVVHDLHPDAAAGLLANGALRRHRRRDAPGQAAEGPDRCPAALVHPDHQDVPASLPVTRGLSATLRTATTPSLSITPSPVTPPSTATPPSLAAPQE